MHCAMLNIVDSPGCLLLYEHNLERKVKMDVQVNYLAVVLAMVSSMVVGATWYSMKVFGKKWAALARVDMEKAGSNVWQPIATAVVAGLVLAYILAHVSYLSNHFFGNSFLQDSLTTAFWLWLGVSVTTTIVHDGFEGRPHLLTLITVSHQLVTIVLMGLIIGLMGV